LNLTSAPLALAALVPAGRTLGFEVRVRDHIEVATKGVHGEFVAGLGQVFRERLRHRGSGDHRGLARYRAQQALDCPAGRVEEQRGLDVGVVSLGGLSNYGMRTEGPISLISQTLRR
jgi:hypothetical protein